MIASTRWKRYSLGLDPLVDHGARLVELDVRRDGGPDQRHREQQERLGGDEVGPHRVGGHLLPVGVGQHGGDRVGDEDEGEEQEDALGVAVGAEEHERPDGHGGDRNREIARDPEELEGGGDAAELGHHQPDVGDGERGDGEGGQAEVELLADEGGQALAGVDGQAGHHLLDDHVRDRDQHHEEERAVDELRARRGVGHDAAGVVAGGCRDQPGTRSGQIDEPPPPRGLHPHDNRRGKWKRPLVGTSASRTSSARMRPIGQPVVVDHHHGVAPRPRPAAPPPPWPIRGG